MITTLASWCNSQLLICDHRATWRDDNVTGVRVAQDLYLNEQGTLVTEAEGRGGYVAAGMEFRCAAWRTPPGA